MKKFGTVVFLIGILSFFPSTILAGTNAGDVEIGAQIILSNTSVDNDDTTTFTIAGKISIFATSWLSLGITPSGSLTESDSGDSSSIFFEFEPNFHFNTSGINVPYFGPHVGFIKFESGTTDETEFSYGAQIGFKTFFSENTALDSQLRFTRWEIFDTEFDDLSLRLGINIYF